MSTFVVISKNTDKVRFDFVEFLFRPSAKLQRWFKLSIALSLSRLFSIEEAGNRSTEDPSVVRLLPGFGVAEIRRFKSFEKDSM